MCCSELLFLKATDKVFLGRYPLRDKKHLYDKFIELVKRNSWYIDLASIFLVCVCVCVGNLSQSCNYVEEVGSCLIFSKAQQIWFCLNQTIFVSTEFTFHHGLFNPVSSILDALKMRNAPAGWVLSPKKRTTVNEKPSKLIGFLGLYRLVGLRDSHSFTSFLFQGFHFHPNNEKILVHVRTFLGPNDA